MLNWILLAATPVIVAVIDTGVAINDTDGHGTMVARAVVASCGDCKVLPIKVSEHGATLSPDILASAVDKATSAGARVINISSGMNKGSPRLASAIANAEKRGALVIAAAGVGLKNLFRPIPLAELSPQSDPHVFVVGLAPAANRTNGNFGDELDLVFESASGGSSAAAGTLSGYAAKLIKEHPKLTPAEIRKTLRRATVLPGNPAAKNYGFGIFKPELLSQSGTDYRIFKTTDGSPVSVDLNSDRDIGTKASATWTCPNEKKQTPARFSFVSLKKGRARLILRETRAGCVLTVGTVGGQFLISFL